MISISFALAAAKLARSEVLVQEIAAIEILARVDTICFDKTGTLTDGAITLTGSIDANGIDAPGVSELALLAAELDPGALGASGLSSSVVVAQLRSAVVDLLVATGIDTGRDAGPAHEGDR